jgi:hypothetical protein
MEACRGHRKNVPHTLRCYYSMDVSGSSDEEDYMHVGKEA